MEGKAINTTTFRDRCRAFRSHPMALVEFLLVHLGAILTGGVVLLLVGYILITGIPNLTPSLFAWKFTTDNQSMMPALVNTLCMTVLTLLMAAPIGIFSAIYLAEYAKRGNKLVKVVRLAAETLSGIPSIVYGLFGFMFFNIAAHWGFSMLAGCMTLAIMVLPLILRTTEEALMSVPDSYREGSFGLGAGKCRTIFKLVLPSAIPGILSGIILSIGRIVGETAALIFTAGTVGEIASGLTGSGRTLAVHMYLLANEGLYIDKAYAVAVVLLVLVLALNGASSLIAGKLSKGE